MIVKQSWVGFLRSKRTSEARLLLGVGGSRPGVTRKLIESRFHSGRIDRITADERLNDLAQLSVEYTERSPLNENLDPRDWYSIGNGAMERVKHIDGVREAGVW